MKKKEEWYSFSQQNNGVVVETDIRMIPLSELHDFNGHPFKVENDMALFELMQSIEKEGVIVPALARPKADGGYELIAGHRRKAACKWAGLSMDMLEDEYGMALASAPSAEDLLMEQEDTNETVATFVELVSSVIEKSPKIGYAVLLLHTGVKGEEFYGKMRLTHGPANRVRQEAESILKDGLANFDVNSITGYKNQFNDVYKEEAYALLNAIVEMFK